MALNLDTRYPGKTNAPTAAYPYGSIKNVTAVGANDGTQLEQDWANDIYGFLQALLSYAGIAPSGTPDEVGASDYLNSLLAVVTAQTNVSTQYIIETNADQLTSWDSSDHLKFVTFTNALSITATMQAPTTPFGQAVNFEKFAGAGDIAVVGAAGVTVEIINGGSAVITTEGQVATLVAKNATTWKMIT